MLGFNRTDPKNAYLCDLSENEVGQTHQGSLGVLARSVIVIHNDEVLTLVKEEGSRVKHNSLDRDHHVYKPVQVVEDA